MTEFTLRQLEVFAATAEQESLTRAAELLHLTQSTASTHLRTLEQILGADLLIRRGQGGVTLTEEGRQLYPFVKKILAQCRTLSDAAKQAGHAPELPLQLGASTVPGQHLLPDLLAAYMHKNPRCRYELRHGDSRQVHRMLRDGQIRIGFVGAQVDNENVTYLPLLQDELVMVTPHTPRYEALQQQGVFGKGLLGEPTIAREAGSGTDRTLQQYMGRIGFDADSLDIIARLDDSEAIKRMVAQGAGVSVLSALSVKKECAEGSVLSFPMDAAGLHRTIYLVYRPDLLYTAAEKDFLSFVLQFHKL